MSKVEYLIIGIRYMLASSFLVPSIDVTVNNFSEWQTTLIEDVICAALMRPAVDSKHLGDQENCLLEKM